MDSATRADICQTPWINTWQGVDEARVEMHARPVWKQFMDLDSEGYSEIFWYLHHKFADLQGDYGCQDDRIRQLNGLSPIPADLA